MHLKTLNPKLIGTPKAVPLILGNPPPHEATARGQTAALAAGLGAGYGVLQNCVGVGGSGGGRVLVLDLGYRETMMLATAATEIAKGRVLCRTEALIESLRVFRKQIKMWMSSNWGSFPESPQIGTTKDWGILRRTLV